MALAREAGLPIERLPATGRVGGSWPVRAIALVRLVRRLRPALIHVHLGWPAAGLPGVVAGSLTRVPTVVTLHLWVPPHRRVRARWRLIGGRVRTSNSPCRTASRTISATGSASRPSVSTSSATASRWRALRSRLRRSGRSAGGSARRSSWRSPHSGRRSASTGSWLPPRCCPVSTSRSPVKDRPARSSLPRRWSWASRTGSTCSAFARTSPRSCTRPTWWPCRPRSRGCRSRSSRRWRRAGRSSRPTWRARASCSRTAGPACSFRTATPMRSPPRSPGCWPIPLGPRPSAERPPIAPGRRSTSRGSSTSSSASSTGSWDGPIARPWARPTSPADPMHQASGKSTGGTWPDAPAGSVRSRRRPGSSRTWPL